MDLAPVSAAVRAARLGRALPADVAVLAAYLGASDVWGSPAGAAADLVAALPSANLASGGFGPASCSNCGLPTSSAAGGVAGSSGVWCVGCAALGDL